MSHSKQRISVARGKLNYFSSVIITDKKKRSVNGIHEVSLKNQLK